MEIGCALPKLGHSLYGNTWDHGTCWHLHLLQCIFYTNQAIIPLRQTLMFWDVGGHWTVSWSDLPTTGHHTVALLQTAHTKTNSLPWLKAVWMSRTFDVVHYFVSSVLSAVFHLYLRADGCALLSGAPPQALRSRIFRLCMCLSPGHSLSTVKSDRMHKRHFLWRQNKTIRFHWARKIQ